jgi:RimJ/RimL family protein N-acetyltransferase
MPSAPSLDPDAGRLTIRPVSADDGGAIAAAFARMGEATRYKRFLTPLAKLSDAQLRYLTDVDERDHVALAATDADGGIVGVARFIRVGPAEAELAIAIVDDFQGRGVGTALIDALADRAREGGVTRLQALVLADNAPMLRLLRRLGEIELVRASEAWNVTVDLAA